ncbi:3149_t:CDS:2 [Paraglomus occultum]|uniref:Ceramide very long chain fatty acid hydroxylase n=1 Tax=Paraglomus occultum TaxID=144539 RepID=A0A9N8ZUI4_9GLOM|nr:3149_t:CDS:2 [Paraglomus occultum]
MPGRMLYRYTREEVAKHNVPDDLWVIFNNKVYDVSEFAVDHPGGADLIQEWGGKEITKIMADSFSHEHSESAYEVLAELCIGDVVNGNCNETSGFDDNTNGVENDRIINKINSINNGATRTSNYNFEDFRPIDTNADADYEKLKFLNLNQPLFTQMLNSKFTKDFYLKQVHQPRHLSYSARLFENDILEMLTKTPWYVIPIIWIPISLYNLSIASERLEVASAGVWFAIGMAIWSVLEYMLHRFLFHLDYYLPDNQYALCVHFALHGIHHYLPMDRYRLVMPPVLGISLAVPILRGTYAVFPKYIAHAAVAGIVFGYVCYDLTHYHLHHARPFTMHLREMKTYHLAHHYKNYELGYGITSKFWDKVFGTLLR